MNLTVASCSPLTRILKEGDTVKADVDTVKDVSKRTVGTHFLPAIQLASASSRARLNINRRGVYRRGEHSKSASIADIPRNDVISRLGMYYP